MVESRVKSIFSHIALEIFMVVGWADEEMQCKWLEGEDCELVNLEKYIGRMLLCVTLNWQSRYFMFMWVVFFRCSHTSVRNRARRRFLVWWLRCDILLFGSFAGEGVPFHWKPDWGMHQMRRYGDEYSRISSFGMICSPFIARIYLVEFARWQGGWFRINCKVLNTLCVVFMFLCIREVFYGHNRPFGVSFVAPRSLSLQFKPINARSFRFTLSMCGYKHIVSVY